MEPEYAGPGSGSGSGSEGVKAMGRLKQVSCEEKMAAIEEEIKRLRQLPPTSKYVSQRLGILVKIQHLLSIQSITSQDEELGSLLSELHL